MDQGAVVRDVLRFLDAQLRSEVDLDEIARIAGYSLSQFYKVFTQVTGQRPAEYIRRRRLALACWDVAFSEQRLIDIAINSGFSSQEAFTRAFQREFHITPGRFRRQHKTTSPHSRSQQRRVDVVMTANQSFPKDRVLSGVMKIGFNLEPDRCPENVPFPSCLASALRYIGEDYPWLPLYEHGREWRLNYGNVHLLGASGMAFGLLWEEGWKSSNVDHMFTADPHIVIAKAFEAAGYQYELVTKTGDEAEEAVWRQKIMDSICRGVPVLAFGVIGPPLCCLITGYENHGEALIGWNCFQDDPAWNHGVEIIEEGYFRKENWFGDTWNLVLIGQKVADYTDVPASQILSWALTVIQQTEVMGRPAGQKAFEAWQRDLLQDDDFIEADDATLQRYHLTHHILVGHLAECRAWANVFLLQLAKNEPEMQDHLTQASQLYMRIHDLMWDVWAVLGGLWNKDAWRLFRDGDARRKIADIIGQAQVLDRQATEHIQQAVQQQERRLSTGS